MPIDVQIGQAIREARHAAAIQEREAAAAINLTVDEYRAREFGQVRFAAAEIFVLSKLCNVTMSQIFDGLGD